MSVETLRRSRSDERDLAPSEDTAVTRTTTCVLDCPDSCTLTVEVAPADDGAHGAGDRVVRIGGAEDHPTTRGFICSKVAGFGGRLDHPDRILTPLRRVGAKGEGRFEPVSWERAVAEIAERLTAVAEEYGPESILPCHYGGSNGVMSEGPVNTTFFARLGASKCGRTLCATSTKLMSTAMYGQMAGVAYQDYPEAEMILVWGANPRASGIHLMPFLREAKKRGAFLAVVDPRRTFSERDVDLHLPVRPGADLPLALGMIHRLEEVGKIDTEFLEAAATGWEPLLEAARAWPTGKAAAAAGIEEADLLRLADAYAESDPALLRCGWGLERNKNGARAVGAVLALPALAGKFAHRRGSGEMVMGVRAGGYTMSNSGVAGFDEAAVAAPVPWTSRTLNMSRLGPLLAGVGDDGHPLDPPVKALFVFNCNPVATVPDQKAVMEGLAREDLFTVVHEQVDTETVPFADYVLPATTFLEHLDVKRGYGAYVVGGVVPVVEPRGEAKPNHELFALLGRELGFEDEVFHQGGEEIFQATARAFNLVGRGGDAETMRRGEIQGYDFSTAARPEATNPVQFGNVFPPTPDGKIHVTPEVLRRDGAEPWGWERVEDSGYPLALISPATSKTISSILGELDDKPLAVTLHPSEAQVRGLESGARVRVFNDLGEAHCVLRLSSRLRPGSAEIPKGAWLKNAANGRTSNALCPHHVDPISGNACYNDARVEIEALP